MIYVRVEIWPGGSYESRRVIGEATIANMSELAEDSEYKVVVSNEGGFMPKDTRPGACVERPTPESVKHRFYARHKRSHGIWTLLRKVFKRIERLEE